jgi:ABC-type transporter Mla subunit MlaD
MERAKRSLAALAKPPKGCRPRRSGSGIPCLDTTGQALARQATALANTAEALAARIGELDRATREAVAPLAAGAADLRRTAEAAQAATAPLRAVASSIGTAVEQIGGAAGDDFAEIDGEFLPDELPRILQALPAPSSAGEAAHR